MGITGYDLTLVGAALGSFAGLGNVNVGGVKVDIAEFVAVDDSDHVPEKKPTVVREGPITGTMKYNKTAYAALRTAAKNHTEDTFTLTDSETSVHAGDGYVTNVGNLQMGPDNFMIFDLELTPETTWTFTAA